MTARILVVDDIITNVKLLEAKLRAEYYRVLTAADGPAALKVAATEKPDLILLDVMMPTMDGFETCQKLKQNPETAHIPVVMVTALSDVTDRVRGLEAGADDFVSKPVSDIALFARVRSLVRLKMMMDELRIRQEATGALGALDGSPVRPEMDAENARILVAEGNDFAARRIIDILGGEGHALDHVTRAEDVASRGREGGYDLIILAFDLDREDGLRLCSELRSQEETRHTPILVMLDDMDLSRLAKGLDLGVTDYLVKPVDRNELIARAHTQIRRRRYHDRLHSVLQKSVSMACTDDLTGIYNRRFMHAHLDRKIMEIGEVFKPVSVMLLDIDHFKQINDTYGHVVGDEILKAVAARVHDNLRSSDLVARYGGEEFVVIMSNTDPEAAFNVAERLRQHVGDQPFVVPGHNASLSITVSGGVATSVDPFETPEQLLDRADSALYEAKHAGRNRVIPAAHTARTAQRRTRKVGS